MMNRKKLIFATLFTIAATAISATANIRPAIIVEESSERPSDVLYQPIEEEMSTVIAPDFTNLNVLSDDTEKLLVVDVYDPEHDFEVDFLGAATPSQRFENELKGYAQQFLGTRYKWGAKGPKAFDCSGFTGYVMRNFGYDIGPCSRVQATRGEKVDLADAKVGDLMFFSRPGSGKNVGHVGMVIEVNPDDGTLKFIHASTKKGVTIQSFPDNGYYSKRFLQMRRVIDDNKRTLAYAK